MARVECSIEEEELDDEGGRTVPGVSATCNECDHRTESFGTSPKSVKRCLALMREECPMGQENFYVADDE